MIPYIFVSSPYLFVWFLIERKPGITQVHNKLIK